MARDGGKKRTRVDLEFERTRRRYDLAKWTLGPAVWLVASWVPLQIAESFSGQDTKLTVSISISIAVTLAGVAGTVANYVKAKRLETENDRLRILNAELEGATKAVRARP